ncbi:hypothetical protein BDF22DRAFT_657903 [Syncephalis plumigaleata]|nr:hypothetical protein BDF22DRAFT_657903 [Syncephalis plumigaleata]
MPHSNMPAIGYTAMASMPAPQPTGYYAQSQKRWSDAASLNTTAVMMAGQLTPGRVMTDLCVATLTTLYPNTQPGSERVSSLRAFIQAVLDAAAVSADVVLLALYYLRKTSSNDGNKKSSASSASLMSTVVDANGVCVDGSTDTSMVVSLDYLSGEGSNSNGGNSPATQLRVRFVAALTCAHKFDADAAYTTRTWADLGGLHPAAVVRAERELLAQLEFNLNFPCHVVNSTAAAAAAAHHNNAYNGYDMSWPTTPTNNAFTIAATDDYFAASRYAYAHASAAAMHGNNGTYYSMPQPYQSQEASPVTYAAASTTAMMMPEPHAPVWPATNGCYPSSHNAGAAMVDYNSCFDATFAVNTAAVSMMPQPVAFYAY